MIKIYKNDAAGAIFIEDDNGAQFYNSIQAVILDPTASTLSIRDNVRDLYLVYEEDYTEFVDENSSAWGTDQQTTANALNAIFTNSGTPTGNVPTITSALTVQMVQGSSLNYELIALYGVGYEWDLSSVPGIVTVEGNVRRLIGGSSLALGSYSAPVKAINYNGEDAQVLTINVVSPPFANTKSTSFQNNDWLGGNAGILQNTLGRAGNGSGAADAWTICFWFKGGTSNNNNQTIMWCGGASTNDNHIRVRYQGNPSNGENINFRYGSDFNYLNLITPIGSVPKGQWKHILISYDGGTTGSASGSVSAYYSRFKIYVDGTLQTTTNSNQNYGNSNQLDCINFRVGRYSSGNYMRNGCKVDELAIWEGDQSGAISSIYNSGTPSNLSSLADPPEHWWRMGDGDTYPFLQDSGTVGSLIFLMYSMSASSIVNDTP